MPNCRVKLRQAIQEKLAHIHAITLYSRTPTQIHKYTEIQLTESFTQREPRQQLVSGSRRIPLESVEHWTSSLAVACGVLCGVSVSDEVI